MNQYTLTVYKASAGSGKTFTLAQTYIYNLLKEKDVTNAHKYILAITFTNKATEEMKNRILGYLDDLKHGKQNDFTHHLQQMLGYDRVTLSEKADKALQGIIHDYDNFDVKTIDSFLQRLLVELSHLLDLPANTKVSLNDDEIITLAVQRLLLSIEQNKQQKQWLSAYIQARADDHENWVIEEEIKKFAKKNVLSDLFQGLDDAHRQNLVNPQKISTFKKQVIQEYKHQEAVLSQKAQDITIELNKLGKAVSRAGEIEKYIQQDFIKFNESKWVQKHIEDGITLAKKDIGKVDASHLHQLLTDYQQAYHSYWRSRSDAELSIKNLYPLQLLSEIDKNIKEVNDETGQMLLSQTKQIFSKFITLSDAPFVFEKSGTRYKHIMIDEFQDTARTQWNNLRKLLIDGLSQGNTGLIVGDIKQSIYRWNGGDWKILHDIAKEVHPQLVKFEELDTNYRSKKEIVDFNNFIFKTAADLLSEDDHTLQEIYADVEQKGCKKEGGYVCGIINEVKKKKEDEGERIKPGPLVDEIIQNETIIKSPYSLYHQIQLLHEKGQVDYAQMAILVRYKTEANSILKYFSDAHPDIPIVSQEAFQYGSSPYVNLLVHISKWLIHDDKLSLVIVARIYQEIIKQNKMLDKERLVKQPFDFLPKELQDVNCLDRLRRIPLYDLFVLLIQIFEFKDKENDGNFQGQHAFVLSFLDEVLAFVENQGSNLDGFIEYWDNTLHTKTISSAETNGIQIITIHKSKGLAFDSVFIPFCDWELEQPRTNSSDFYWWETPNNSSYADFPILPITPSKKQNIHLSSYNAAYEEEEMNRKIDNFNTLYVAFTRPKNHLLFWCKQDEKKDTPSKWKMGDLMAYTLAKSRDTLICAENEELFVKTYTAGAITALPNPIEKVENPLPFTLEIEKNQPLSMNYYPSRQIFRQSSLSNEYWHNTDHQHSNISPIEQGVLYHKLLSLIKTTKDIRPVVNEMEIQGLLPIDTDAEQIINYLEKKMESPVISNWFSGAWTCYNEHAILYKDESGFYNKYPDRVIMKADQTVVIDFKFGAQEHQHKRQVKHYMQLLKKMQYPHVEGYLWYVELDKIIEVK